MGQAFQKEIFSLKQTFIEKRKLEDTNAFYDASITMI